MDSPPNYVTRPPSPWPFLGPPQGPDEIGRLGQYRILKQLGQGGMGVVFQAEDTQLRRLAALKVMLPELAAREHARARFLREARAAAALKHDNVVTIYQVGEDGPVPFLAMEFLTGKSLEEWLRPDRRATIPEALTLGKQIAKGLAAAHAAGLIHRDIKPANLWLEAPRGRVKILDFGLARNMAGEFTALTQSGAVVGTPAYMAPEQARGEVVDHRCDLFSFGCILYRMVTGRMPFQGNTLYAVLAAIATETPPSVQELNPTVPAALASLIERLLAKAPADRPASAQVVLDELQQIEKEYKEKPGAARGEPSSAGVPPALPTSWGLGLAGAGVLLILVLGLVWGLSRGTAPVAEPRPAPALQAETKPPEPAVAAPVDLLALIDLVRDKRMGIWQKTQGGGLRGHADPNAEGKRKAFFLALPWEPPPAYRLRFTVVRWTDGLGALRLHLSQGSTRFALVFDVRHPENDQFYYGLQPFDGRKIYDQPDAQVGQIIPAKQLVRLACTVEAGKVVVEANGQRIYQWQGDMEKLRALPVPRLGDLALGGSNDAEFVFANLVLESLGPDAGRPSVERP